MELPTAMSAALYRYELIVRTKTFSPVEKVARRFSAVTDKGIAACDIEPGVQSNRIINRRTTVSYPREHT